MRYKKLVKFNLLVFVFMFLAGCANWQLKEKCSKTNWFEYSQNIAFEGKYLEEDGFIKACKAEDLTNAVQLDLGFKNGREKMCQYDEIFNRAKEGVPVFFKFCDGLEMGQMKELYRRGLVLYCTKDKGYSFGKAGKVYQNLCNAQQEKDFLPGYYLGRKQYLSDFISRRKDEMDQIKDLEQSYARTEWHLSQEYSRLPSNAEECKSVDVYDESTKKVVSRKVCQEVEYIRSRRTALWRDLDNIRDKLVYTREKWGSAEKDINQAQMDLSKIP